MKFDPTDPVLSLEGVISSIESGDIGIGLQEVITLRLVQAQVERLQKDLMCAEDAYVALRRAFGEINE